MKLFNALAAVAVVGTSAIASSPANSQDFMSECLRTSANSGISYEGRKKYCQCAYVALQSGDSMSTAAEFCNRAYKNM